MALTRVQIKEILSKAGASADKMESAIEDILSGHTASIDALKEEREKYKMDAEKLPALQTQLETLSKAAGKDAYKVKYEALQQEYENYKNGIEAEAAKTSKIGAYKALLKELKISDRIIDGVVKLADFDELELDNDGKLKNAKELSVELKKEWQDFIFVEDTKNVPPSLPPKDGASGGKAAFDAMPLSERMKYANEHPVEAAAWIK